MDFQKSVGITNYHVSHSDGSDGITDNSLILILMPLLAHFPKITLI